MACPVTTPDTRVPDTHTPTAGWTLAWSDEFNGKAGDPVDSTIWSYDIGDGCASGICGWGNQERETYTSAAANVSLNGQGQLVIVARPAPGGLSCYYGACRYTSAKIKTQGKALAQPGRVEARIKIPEGQGLWPAFWMLGSSFPATKWPDCGELDIMENHGHAPNQTSSAMHGPGYFGNTPFANGYTLPSGKFSDDFHVFAVEWNSARVLFFVDSALQYSVTRAQVEHYGPWVFDQPFFVVLNLAVGGNFDGDPASDAILPATMVVDYVRVYMPTTSAASATPATGGSSLEAQLLSGNRFPLHRPLGESQRRESGDFRRRSPGLR
jgi:beta-glucanase (GH16 family)